MTIYLGCIKMPLTGSLRKQDEKYDVKNYADWEDQWSTWIQLDTAPSDNSSHHSKTEFNHCFIIHSKYVTVKDKTHISGKTVSTGKTYQLILYQSIPKLPIPPSGSPSGPWVCLNIFAQIPPYADSLDGQMPHHLALWKFSNLSPNRDYSKMFLCVKPSIQM